MYVNMQKKSLLKIVEFEKPWDTYKLFLLVSKVNCSPYSKDDEYNSLLDDKPVNLS